MLVVAALAFLALAAMWRTAYLGGHINHVEIRPDVVAKHKARLDILDAETTHPGSQANAPVNCPWQAAVDDVAKTQGEPAVDKNQARTVGDFVIGHTWMWPTLETLHFVGLCLLFAAVLIVNLRLLGMMKVVPYSRGFRLRRSGLSGLAITLFRGSWFSLGFRRSYTGNRVSTGRWVS